MVGVDGFLQAPLRPAREGRLRRFCSRPVPRGRRGNPGRGDEAAPETGRRKYSPGHCRRRERPPEPSGRAGKETRCRWAVPRSVLGSLVGTGAPRGSGCNRPLLRDPRGRLRSDKALQVTRGLPRSLCRDGRIRIRRFRARSREAPPHSWKGRHVPHVPRDDALVFRKRPTRRVQRWRGQDRLGTNGSVFDDPTARQNPRLSSSPPGPPSGERPNRRRSVYAAESGVPDDPLKGGARIAANVGINRANKVAVSMPGWKAVPPKNDQGYLDLMSRAIFTAGLNWSMVEKKWPHFRKAFRDFSPERVARLSERDILGVDAGSGNCAEREENPRDGRERQDDVGFGKTIRFGKGVHRRLWAARREATGGSPIQVQTHGPRHRQGVPLVGRISPHSYRGGEAVDEGPSGAPLATNTIAIISFSNKRTVTALLNGAHRPSTNGPPSSPIRWACWRPRPRPLP